jgi:hypothetical protein
MTGRQMPGFLFFQWRRYFGAERGGGVRTAGVERTAGGRGKGGRDIPLQYKLFFSLLRPDPGDGGKEGFGIGMKKATENGFPITGLDNFPQVHYCNTVAHVADNRKVVGDEEKGK